jgi:sulfide:quinone oxidoreductase
MTRTPRVRRPDFKTLIIGGGVAGLEAMLAMRAFAADHVDVELVSAEQHFYYRPLAVAEPFGLGSAHRWELDGLVRKVGAAFSMGTLVAVDGQRRVAEFASGLTVEYDALLLALGARPQSVVPGALTFRGSADAEPFRLLLDKIELQRHGRLLFAVPSGPVWPLPLYELALLTAAEFERKRVSVQIGIVTSEPSALALFGTGASEVVQHLLEERQIALWPRSYPAEFADGALSCVPEKSISADWVVACPRLAGPDIAGLPREGTSFIPVDEFGRVRGADRIYAAGDATSFPIKQGGIAAAQADVAARSIAASAGADVDVHPFRPVLRALLLSGAQPTFMRVELSGGRGDTSTVSEEALWWPPGKIVGRYLSPFLASLGIAEAHDEDEDVLRVEIDAATAHELAGS